MVGRIDSPEWEFEGIRWHDCQSCDDTLRAVWFVRPGQAENGSAVVVEGTLRVIHHRATVGKDGTRFPEFVEYRLVHCRRVD